MIDSTYKKPGINWKKQTRSALITVAIILACSFISIKNGLFDIETVIASNWQDIDSTLDRQIRLYDRFIDLFEQRKVSYSNSFKKLSNTHRLLRSSKSKDESFELSQILYQQLSSIRKQLSSSELNSLVPIFDFIDKNQVELEHNLYIYSLNCQLYNREYEKPIKHKIASLFSFLPKQVPTLNVSIKQSAVLTP